MSSIFTSSPTHSPQLEAIPRPQSEQTNHDATTDTCVVCLDNITERATTIPCKHSSFDFLCIVSWLQEQPSCPLCKATITEVRYDYRGPDDFKRYLVKPKEAKNTSSAPVSREEALRNRASGRGGRFGRFSDRRGRGGYGRERERNIEVDENSALLRRRYVYRHGLYSLHVGANRISRFRTITPVIFSGDAELQSRARAWVRRELRVFPFLHPDTDATATSSSASAAPTRAGNAEFLLEYVIAILKSVDIKDANGQAEDMLQEFLGRDNARLFLHELGAWLKSPYTNVKDWDRHVQYAERLPETFVDGEPVDGGKSWSRENLSQRHQRNDERRERRYEPYSRSRGTGTGPQRDWRRYEPD